MFEAETIVRLRDNPAQTGRTTGVTRDVSGRLYVEVEMADGSGKSMYPSGQLVLNAVARSIFDDLREGRFAEPRQLKNLLLHHRLTGRLRDVLYSMDVTDTDFHAYQFKPVVKLIGSPSQSLLIADEVGLGKTIEAGLAWTELVARFDCHRLLVLCPKSLTKKWQAELRQKFSVHAKIVDAAELLDVLKRQREQDEEFALIASTSSVRPHNGWKEEDAPEDVRTQLARFLDEQEADDPLVDCLIFDEAHHMRNRSTMNHELGELATAVSDYKLFLSATPINLNGQDLRSLLELLDPETFDSEDTFKVLIEENKPLVAARDLVLDPRSSFDVIIETLRTIPRGQLLKVDNQLDQLQRELQRPDLADSPDFRTRVAAHLEAMSLLGSIVNRTRRRDVNEIKVQRRPGCMRWKMTDQEASFYERATAVVREHAAKANMNERFLLATPQRLIASSLPAAYRHWMGKAANYSVDDEDHEDEVAGGPLVEQLARLCSDPQELQELEDGDVKFTHLLSSIKKQRKSDPNGKLIVFSSFRTTLDYLHGRLKECGIRVEIMHGAVREARTDILDRFEATKDPCILLTSEVGGEGLDMQFCRVLVNYDLPWNPMKVEQRIGRIDRIGQQSPTIEIMSLICRDTIEEQVYDRLYKRIMQIEETLGAFEAVLGTELKGIESTMLDPAMTPDEQAAEIERRAIAMQETVRTTKELEEEAAGLIAHGDMILERINASRTAERRVTGPELADYVHQAISNRHPGSRIDDVPGRPGLYQVTLSAQAQVALKEVMTRSGRGRTKLMKEPRVEAVFERIEGMPRNAELITALHPLVRLAARIRGEISEGVSMEPVASVMVSHVDVDLAPGTYVTMIERWGVEGAVRIDRMGFAAHAPDGSLLPSDDAERLVHLAMRLGRHDAPQLPGDELDAVARRLHDQELDQACNAFVSEETARHEDRIATGMARIERQRHRAADRMDAQRQRAMDASDSRRAGRMRILGAAEAKHRRLVARLDLKREELRHAQQKFNWSRNTVGMCVVRVA